MATSVGNLYDTLMGDMGSIYYEDEDLQNIEYPASNMITVFGPIYAPRIYGKDLTAFEIASSGAVAISLEDIQSFLLTRDVISNNVMINTMSNDSFAIYTNNSNMSLVFDANSNNALLYAQSNVTVQANSNIHLSAADRLIISANEYGMSILNDIELSTGNDIVLSASNNMFMSAVNDYSLSANSNITIVSSNASVSLLANNASIVMDAVTDKMSLFSSNTISVTSSNDINIFSKSDVFVTADTGGLLMSANNSNVYILMDASTQDMTMYTSNNFKLTSSNDMVLSAVGSIQTTAVNVGLNASGSFDLISGASATIAAASNLIFSSANSNVTITLDSDKKNLDIYVLSNISMNSSNSTFMVASNIMSSTGMVANTMKTTDFTYFTLSNNNSAYLTASNIYTNAGSGTMYETANKFDATFSNSMNYINSANKTVFQVLPDRVVIDGGLDITGTINTLDTTVTTLLIQDKTVILSHSSNGSMIYDGEINTKSGFVVEGMPHWDNDINIPFNATDPAFSSIYEKSIKWNYHDTDDVEGFQYNVGMGGIRTDAIASESFWEVKGGGLRLTASKPILGENGLCTGSNVVSFGLRINHLDELEVVKKYYDGDKYLIKRVAKFGRVLI
jgi:uncharacterized protein (DUF2345 family)